MATPLVNDPRRPLRGLFLPTDRRVRTTFNGRDVAASSQVMLLRDSGVDLHYFFPLEDVDTALLEEAGQQEHSPERGDLARWSLSVDGKRAEAAAWSYRNAPEGRPATDGYLTFDWDAMDEWFEESERVYVHPRDPFHRVDAVLSDRHIRVELDGVELANSRRPVTLFETGLPTRFYLPPEDVERELLTPTALSTRCPYKGLASYWSVNANGTEYENHVWGYPEPIAEAPKIKGLLSFFNEKVDIYQDGELLPRPRTSWS